MFDTVSLGKRILERRKVKGFTQEQLGAELGVSGQSVSKWENGETAPDIGLMPSLCKALGASSDILLSIDNETDIETLAIELANRIAESSERGEALIRVLRYLALMGKEDHATRWTGDIPNYLECEWKGESVAALRLWRNKGLACFATDDIMDEAPFSESLNQIRMLLAPIKWDIALTLAEKTMKEKDLLGLGIGSSDEVKGALSEMIDAGLLRLDRNGYCLDCYSGLPWTVFIKAMCVDLQAEHTSVYFNKIP